MISTKGRYALRILVDLAEQDGSAPVPLKEIAFRQGVSVQYLQHIAKLLVTRGLLVGTSGKSGGYLMTRPPEECTVAEVLAAAEETLAPVACLACGTVDCERQAICKTLPMWQKFDAMTRDFFDGVTIADLANESVGSAR